MSSQWNTPFELIASVDLTDGSDRIACVDEPVENEIRYRHRIATRIHDEFGWSHARRSALTTVSETSNLAVAKQGAILAKQRIATSIG